jgi:5'(3')-deoxyribonucleotidase
MVVKYKIYQDLDGCLANFDQGFHKLTHKYPSQYEKDHGREQFWNIITESGAKFWSELRWMPGGRQLWNYISKYNPAILTAPSRHDSSREGKQQWVTKYMPGTELLFEYSQDKKKYASPTSILIDDREDNISQWIEAGGLGIQYLSTDDTINQLKQLGL